MTDNRKPVPNSLSVFREEFDDWAILFNPDTGKAVGLNPVSAFIWKLLDGNHTQEDILRELKENYEEVHEDAAEHLREYIEQLVQRGYIGYEMGEK
jgi:SynChlorMet cassette protein ScmD